MAKRGKASARPTVEARAKHLKDLCSDLGGRVGAPAEKEKAIYVSTGVDTLDVASGVGGFRQPGHIILHGRESCVAEGTLVMCQGLRADGMLDVPTPEPVEVLFERLHGQDKPKSTSVWMTELGPVHYVVHSADQKDRFFENPLLDVVDTGTKECFEVKTYGGLSIVATDDQLFYVGGESYRPLSDLVVSDVVMVRKADWRYPGVLDHISSIVPVGPRRTFDVKVAGPHHNYTANNFVLHNCGKTTVALSWCQKIIENDGYPLYLDVERKLNFKYAAEGGVDLDSLIRPKSIPRSIEAAMFFMERFIIKARALSATAPIGIVFDSMQAMVAGRAFKQQEGAPADQKKAYEAAWQDEARAYSVGFRLLNPILSEYGATICWISQVRADIGAGYSGAESVGVGKAPRFYAVQILNWKKVTPVKIGSKAADGISGVNGMVKFEKNQDGRAFTIAQVPIRFGEGIDRAAAALYAATAVGLAKKRAGGWYRLNVLGEEFDVRGVAGVREFFATEPETFAAWRQEIRALVGQVELQVDPDFGDGEDEDAEDQPEETDEGEADGD